MTSLIHSSGLRLADSLAPLTPTARRMVLTPGPGTSDPRIRRYRLARVALKGTRPPRVDRSGVSTRGA